MTKELQQVVQHNDQTEKDRWSRFAAAMIFCSAVLYWLWF